MGRVTTYDVVDMNEVYQAECEHENKTYQAHEPDVNVPESYSCDDCGKELDIPEPDWDEIGKEDRLNNIRGN
mgnify:CR=1 FL=1|tara:strand:+ start:1060 stop:1275 length:216 start_codon:yes stop_codon:yes gene_type:complete